MSTFFVLVSIALRNLFTSFLNLIIGLLILVGTMLVVVGGAMVDSLDSSMSKSIIGSVAGNAQIYSTESKEELSVYGNMGGADSDLEPMNNFAQVKESLTKVENVDRVVPMGISVALITSGNTVDLILANLRELYKERKDKGGSPELDAKIQSRREHVQQIIKVLKSDLERTKAVLNEKAIDPEVIASLHKVDEPQFWVDFDKDPFNGLEFLENNIAPQITDADLLFIRYVGTDLDAFQKSFDRLKIVDGTAVPEGKRGFLFAKFFYEEFLKLKSARRLDKIKEKLSDGLSKIAGDPVLERYIKENQSQTREIVLQLDGQNTKLALERINKELGTKETELAPALTKLMTIDDANFERRYTFFYEAIAPMLEMYRVRVGDVLTIKAFTKSGYVQSVSVKVYGTFDFEGLEKSPLAGGINLMDLMSFRELYGYLTAEKMDEIKQLKATAGTTTVERGKAEEELFGGGNEVVAETSQAVIDESKIFTGSSREYRKEDLMQRVYTPQEIESGVVLNAAVLLKDPSKLKETLKAINDVSARDKLGIKAVGWRDAAGLLGQFVLVAKTAIYSSAFFIFVIAMVVILIAMMIATLQRTQTIGTMRAIGAQRSFVLGMVLIETTVLGVIFGTVGVLLGSGIMMMLKSRGIPATSDIMWFFFSGPRLYPTLGAENIIAAFVIVIIVSALATLIPAILATRISPLQAMQSEE